MQAQSTGQSAEGYCTDLINSNQDSALQCHERCTQCFGLAADQCFDCEQQNNSNIVDLVMLCNETSVAAEIRNVSDMFYVFNCSSDVGLTTAEGEGGSNNRYT